MRTEAAAIIEGESMYAEKEFQAELDYAKMQLFQIGARLYLYELEIKKPAYGHVGNVQKVNAELKEIQNWLEGCLEYNSQKGQ